MPMPTPTSGTAAPVNPLTQLFDYDGSGNLIYIGWAPLGSTGASAAWAIQKNTYNGSSQLTQTQWANPAGPYLTLYSNVWNNRASLTYS